MRFLVCFIGGKKFKYYFSNQLHMEKENKEELFTGPMIQITVRVRKELAENLKKTMVKLGYKKISMAIRDAMVDFVNELEETLPEEAFSSNSK